MDMFSNSSDSLSTSWSPEISRPANLSDEEVLLASSNPKKRAGRKKFRETRHPVYRGVRRRNSEKWVSEVREPNKKSRIWLGTYPTSEMAARAHDVAAIALRGRSACLNFADSAWRLPVPASGEARDIQKAAAEAAEAFRPTRVETGDDVAAVGEPEKLLFMDEEEVWGMPWYIADMARGLMVPPPTQDLYDADFDADVSLWSYSF
uniref:CRT/DRE-binding factor 1 n=3 Tax=Pentapetalae TaxID=1437201 RepID=W5VTX2_AVIMR|nr:C-repeat binding factor 1 [Bruguiera gymnorhiza]AFU81299.1 C-repeat binding factor 1 [Aegiceras corniculatum]AHH86059.1 CRT/DRE-binding factor 1 [Avicennia marina]